ncbi:hypothetical protein L1987_21728 [Smallanthus sonchifolius]|uniref:Uncharacterized protein n=1 Tax=Smallanthus sonchifolius TaxID=185202 RepID=A0ACB9IED8_9ASTR|nr:hypothetical protein L1987_21728 [Smallanthus sonchifolius]
MELQFHTIAILILLITLLWPIVESQSLNIPDIQPARVLDAVLQNYAYTLRLRSGSLFTRGVPMYKEFKIPIGVIEQPYVERLVLVYQNLGNWSVIYYPLPGYIYLAPVLGLLAYDGSDLSSKNQPELEIQASDEPISIDFGSVRPAPHGSNPMCVWVDLHGQVNFTNVVSGNRCLAFKQGHFSIVVKSNSTPPSGPVSPPLVPPATSEVVRPDKNGGIDSRVWAFVVYVVGGCVLLVLLAVLVLWIRGYRRRKWTHKMERAAEGGEPLHMTMIGSMKAPAAMVTRTQPTLETEYVP